VQAFIRRKVRLVDKDAITRIMVPGPLPLSWGRTVRPYAPPAQQGALPGPGSTGQPPGAAAEPSSGSDENRDLNGDAAAATEGCGASPGACVAYREEPDLARANLRALAAGQSFQVGYLKSTYFGQRRQQRCMHPS
jgi:hypothetical protein